MNRTLRERVIAEWRGLREKPQRPDRARPAADALALVMKQLGLGERLNEAQIRAAWRELVGDFLAQHSAPSRIVHGVLVVNVIQSAVHYELDRSLKADILKKLQARFGKRIRDVKFKIG